ncbi:DUF5666 domain-containing protein [Thiomicrorhabdus sp. zzn3]|uniref:DUF5666 domain-containing protein n=1 Tax=Thiomicrorhabdus sp. zzn3 TaxID=3039775 RepID=UPI002436C09A|nr:DUF5666 domain-containing protein [Thiomicrorhabdus sp. zzn3]MDG6777538.1 DUF5666 domain-containing protein [Thiomicrorhabdus sp. zzn3]
MKSGSTDLKPIYSEQASSGFGGTGKTGEPIQLATLDAVRHSMELDSGFGGTGHTSKGFGGTGIIGTIDQFGSIWVNGIEVGLGQKTQIFSNLPERRDGLPASALRLGQQVWLETHLDNDKTTTAAIHIYYPLAGKIEALTSLDMATEILVNGQRVYIDQATHLDSTLKLKVGEYVRISGLPVYQQGTNQRENAWQATLVEPQAEAVSWLKAVPDVSFSDQVNRVVMQENWLRAYRAGELVNLKQGLSTQPKIKMLGKDLEAANSNQSTVVNRTDRVNRVQSSRSGLSGTGRTIDSLQGVNRNASSSPMGAPAMGGSGRR